jgi:hypothetical protein
MSRPTATKHIEQAINKTENPKQNRKESPEKI